MPLARTLAFAATPLGNPIVVRKNLLRQALYIGLCCGYKYTLWQCWGPGARARLQGDGAAGFHISPLSGNDAQKKSSGNGTQSQCHGAAPFYTRRLPHVGTLTRDPNRHPWPVVVARRRVLDLAQGKHAVDHFPKDDVLAVEKVARLACDEKL